MKWCDHHPIIFCKKVGCLSKISHSERVLKWIISIRPAKESDKLGSNKALADPVKRNRPGLRFSSTACFMETNSSGKR